MNKKYLQKSIEYIDPLSFFNTIPKQNHISFLYSSSNIDYANQISIIGLFPYQIIKTNSLKSLFSQFSQSKSDCIFENAYIGHIAYEVKNELEKLPTTKQNQIRSQLCTFVKYELYLIFNSKERKLDAYFLNDSNLDILNHLKTKEIGEIEVDEIQSNFTKETYLDSVNNVRDYIIKGDIFEANLTAKFSGKFKYNYDGREIFSQLVTESPSQYSAYIKQDDLEIISSSPERFIHADYNKVSSKPIKGTRKRDPKYDEMLISELLNSEKDRAENLMIVDLVRNDLGRVAKIGTIQVPDIFKIERYQTVLQMVSTISCELREDKTYNDLINATFPPGSMTGAPKIRAMEIISELEKFDRGIYSGAIGIINPDRYLDLSVVIRTIIKNKEKFEFQAGGAIVYDSVAEDEYTEMLDKLAAIEKILKIDLKNL